MAKIKHEITKREYAQVLTGIISTVGREYAPIINVPVECMLYVRFKSKDALISQRLIQNSVSGKQRRIRMFMESGDILETHTYENGLVNIKRYEATFCRGRIQLAQCALPTEEDLEDDLNLLLVGSDATQTVTTIDKAINALTGFNNIHLMLDTQHMGVPSIGFRDYSQVRSAIGFVFAPMKSYMDVDIPVYGLVPNGANINTGKLNDGEYVVTLSSRGHSIDVFSNLDNKAAVLSDLQEAGVYNYSSDEGRIRTTIFADCSNDFITLI